LAGRQIISLGGGMQRPLGAADVLYVHLTGTE
jgi:hypothetical protein